MGRKVISKSIVCAMLAALLICGFGQRVTIAAKVGTGAESNEQSVENSPASDEGDTSKNNSGNDSEERTYIKNNIEKIDEDSNNKVLMDKVSDRKDDRKTTNTTVNNRTVTNSSVSSNSVINSVNTAEDETEEEQDTNYRVEQVKVSLPYIYAYCYAENIDVTKNVSIDDSKLTFIEEDVNVTPVHYYILVDESQSYDSSYWDEIIKCLENLPDRIGKNDKLELISISGEEPPSKYNPVNEKSIGQKQDISEYTNELNQDDSNTYLYKTIELMAEQIDSSKRNVVIVISDCVDDSVGKTINEESAEEALEKNNIPLYALILKQEEHQKKTGDNDKVSKVRNIVDEQGGIDIDVEIGELDSCMESMIGNIQNVDAYKYYSDMESSNVTCKFVVEGTKLEKKVVPNQYTPEHEGDKNVPDVEVEQIDESRVRVTFDRPVDGIGKADNFKIKSSSEGGEESESYEVKEVVLKQEGQSALPWENKMTVELKLDKNEILYNGTYRVEFTDEIVSAYGEPQKPKGETSFTVEGQKHPSKVLQFLKNFWWIIASFIVLLIVVLVIYRRIKKKGGVVYVENQAVLTDNIVQKQHVHVERGKSLFIKFVISGGGKESIEISSELKGSLIVGRSDLSDVFIDDSMMSRQHFAITDEDGVLYIQDLETTNGTMLNGVRINGKKKLLQDDVISAGSLQIRIYW